MKLRLNNRRQHKFPRVLKGKMLLDWHPVVDTVDRLIGSPTYSQKIIVMMEAPY